MILKDKDDRSEDIAELNRLLSLKLSSKQRFLIERELKCQLSGNSGESSSAYYLNFKFGHRPEWIVIHDLRVEHKGQVAQIDHILINRCLQVHVIETKNYFYGIQIKDNGEFESFNGKSYQGIESPLEQNKRHIELLERVIEQRSYAPTRLGLPIPVTYKSCVMIAPSAKIVRPSNQSFDTSMVIKADAYSSFLESEYNKMSTLSTIATATRIIGQDTLEEFSKKILRLHRPGKFNYAAKFGIDEAAVQSIQVNSTSPRSTKAKENRKPTATKVCDKCGVEVEEKVAYFCRMNKAKFDGKVLCRECQHPLPDTVIESGRELSFCDSCNAEVDSKVVYFCRVNKKKFDGMVLCRDCQLTRTK